MNDRTALFVSHASSLRPGGGGVQRCTREYRLALATAGFQLTELGYTEDQRLATRIRRRLHPRPYAHKLPPLFGQRCVDLAAQVGARWIFLNHGDTAPLAEEIERRAPGRHRFVLLSHGLDSTDTLHEVRIRFGKARRRDEAWLGAQLFAEMGQRQHLDAVLCLSSIDEQLERWLGARRVAVIPRILVEKALVLTPVSGRLGTVSTLDHPPNLEGIELFAAALGKHPGVRLRLVGGPRRAGERLARTFPNIDYLGVLDDVALAAEAATWCAFINPLFCYPRGASTKLAQALGWGLPVATTRAGARGYRWDEALIPLPSSPAELARQAAGLATLENFSAARAAVAAMAALSPTAQEVAGIVRELLAGLA